jgi:hypothetical protein
VQGRHERGQLLRGALGDRALAGEGAEDLGRRPAGPPHGVHHEVAHRHERGVVVAVVLAEALGQGVGAQVHVAGQGGVVEQSHVDLGQRAVQRAQRRLHGRVPLLQVGAPAPLGQRRLRRRDSALQHR